MAIATVAIWRPNPGRFQDFIATAAQAKKIHDRLGGSVRIWQTQIGGEPMTLAYVIEHEDWNAFGKFAAKQDADSEFQQLRENFLANPPANLVQTSVLVEPPELK